MRFSSFFSWVWSTVAVGGTVGGGAGFLITFFFAATAAAGAAAGVEGAAAVVVEDPAVSAEEVEDVGAVAEVGLVDVDGAEPLLGAAVLLPGEDTAVASSRRAAAASVRPGDMTAVSPPRLVAREGVAARSLVDEPITALYKRPLDDDADADDDDEDSSAARPLPLVFALLGLLSFPRQLNIVACVW